MAQIQVLPPPGVGMGGTIQGEWGTYVEASDGTFTIDSRDAAALMAMGFTHAPAGTGAVSSPQMTVAGKAPDTVTSEHSANTGPAPSASPPSKR